MKINKTCEICGTPFVAIKVNQRFDKRACFKKSYNITKREERKHDRETNPARWGFFVCSFCGLKSPLPYSPKRYKKKFEDYCCPGCNTPRFKDTADMNIEWEHDLERFGLGWKNPAMPYREVIISATFATYLSGGKPPTD